ncbi:uroporphyrinogen-III synthase [Kiloniella litopenaei]|uniref:uroporphyrinogen-III synthase n=1 Tax=Kiloniella litopenaei TaxID=1549748 RepID=UPI0006988BEB|nr:uroporphyrinogen-III synthase [Kiloniella litopenaei]
MITHLVTRPQADQEPFASELRQLGREVFLDPVFDIVFRNSVGLDLSGVQAVIFTSANGVRAYQLNSKDCSLPALCVGENSAIAARESGFEQVYSANGDVGDLAELVRRKLKPGSGTLLHPAASKVAGDLQADLGQCGYAYRREILYEATASKTLLPQTKKILKENKIKEISFFSPRSSKVFLSLLSQENLLSNLQGTAIYCLSKAVADCFGQMPGLKLLVSELPNRADMIKLIASNK